MIDPQSLELTIQLIDNMEKIANDLEKAYNKGNGKNFNKARLELLEIQEKLKGVID